MWEVLLGIARMVWGTMEIVYESFGGGSDRLQKKRAKKQQEDMAKNANMRDKA